LHILNVHITFDASEIYGVGKQNISVKFMGTFPD